MPHTFKRNIKIIHNSVTLFKAPLHVITEGQKTHKGCQEKKILETDTFEYWHNYKYLDIRTIIYKGLA
jgi:hypothetical protein